MTQEELDALMAGDLDENEIEESNEKEESSSEDLQQNTDPDRYRVNASAKEGYWPPPPPTDDHRVVNQLDDVTKDSEVKATEIFDKLETISEFAVSVENDSGNILTLIDDNIRLFEKLSVKFPNIDSFKKALDENQKSKERVEDLVSSAQMANDEIMMIMDIMQYQDIHRQKIERVINVIRTLAGYMNSLFAGNIADDKRVSSATHIEGDATTDDVVTNEDIEALISSLGKK